MKYDGLLIDKITEAVERAEEKAKHLPPTTICPDCEIEVPTETLVECCDCHHICCSDCLLEHSAQPHLTDYDNSPQAHGAWRRYDC